MWSRSSPGSGWCTSMPARPSRCRSTTLDRPHRAARRRDVGAPRAGGPPLRRAARELLGLRRARAPVEARARRAAGRDLPHPRPGQGGRGGRRRPRAAGARRAGDHQLHRSDPRVDGGRARAARRPLRRRSRPHRDRPAGGRPRDLQPGRTGGPGGRARALDLDDRPALLFVGRIQPLKGARLAVKTLAALEDPRAVLLVVGGPSGAAGTAELEALHGLARSLGVFDQVRFVPPQPHERLATFYRAADVCLVPEPHGVLRARRARGRRVRHAGRRRRRRRPALPRRRRQHRVPRRRPGPGRLRGPGRRCSCRMRISRAR